MAGNFSLPLLFLLSLLLLISTTTSSATTKSSTTTPTNFIKSSCSVTRYPALCIDSLSTFAATIQKSPRQMAQTALAVSLSRARSAKVYLVQMSRSNGLKKREYQVMKDCVDNMGDSVDRLSKSIYELGHMGGGTPDSFIWHMSNVQTWCSAALTDENTCMDGFAGKIMDGKLKSAVRGKILGVAQVTSNALALVNRFADRH